MVGKGGGVGLRSGDTDPLKDSDATAGPLVNVLKDLSTGDLIERTPLGPLVGPAVELPMAADCRATRIGFVGNRMPARPPAAAGCLTLNT